MDVCINRFSSVITSQNCGFSIDLSLAAYPQWLRNAWLKPKAIEKEIIIMDLRLTLDSQ